VGRGGDRPGWRRLGCGREFREVIWRLISALLFLIEHPNSDYTKKYFADVAGRRRSPGLFSAG
jgi:hypothetical protein